MEAAARGAVTGGGMVVGLLPGSDRAAGNPYPSIAAEAVTTALAAAPPRH